jgi:hypothetical protein
MIVGVQVHTAGGFTFAEALTDSILSPLVAKAVGMAVSSETVARFAKTARAEHHRLLSQILEESCDRFRRHFESKTEWRGGFEGLASEMVALERERAALLAEFGGREEEDPEGGVRE